MRILCLPGYGTTPAIMRRQMAPLLKHCDPSWDFYFLEAKVECPPAPGIPKSTPGPFLCWTEDFGPTENRAAMDLIHRTFAREGPFDGVFGFSQGASIALAYLLEQQQQQQQASKPLPVKFGVFASPPPILATDSAYVQGMYGGLSPEDLNRLRSADRNEISRLPEPIRTAGLLLFENLAIMASVHGKSLSYFFDRPVGEIPCVLVPDVCPLRLEIPTLQVCSRDDPAPMQGASEIAAEFCEHRSKKVFRHGAVHNLPRDVGEAREMARLMREIIEGIPGVSRL